METEYEWIQAWLQHIDISRYIVYRAWLICKLDEPVSSSVAHWQITTMIRRPQYFHSPNKKKFIQFSLVAQARDTA